MKGTGFINRFCGKILTWANRRFLGPKIMDPHNSGLAVRIFFEFRAMKGASRYMKVILMVLTKKFLLNEMDHFGSEYSSFGSKNDTSS